MKLQQQSLYFTEGPNAESCGLLTWPNSTEFNKYSAAEGLLHSAKSKKTKCNDLAGNTLHLYLMALNVIKNVLTTTSTRLLLKADWRAA